MSDIKQDVKESIKIFTQAFITSVVKESTKKLIKSLTQRQKKLLEARTKKMSDDQLEKYFAKNTYFKNALESTVRSVNSISLEKGTGSRLNKVQEVYEATYVKNLMKILIWPAPNVIIASLAIIALLITVAIPIAISGSNTINTKLPLANFSSNVSSGYCPFSVQFADLSQNATKWNWDFGDGGNSTERQPVHTYSSAGNYTVSLTATNKKGTDSKTAPITVLEQTVMPMAHFSSSITDGHVPLYVQFTDLSQNATGWNWDFGDGTNSTEENPTHIYSSPREYPVILTVNNGKGTDSEFALITARGEPVLPFANFSSSTTKGYIPLSIRFTDLSRNATAWKWDFGDGDNSTEQNPTHVYSSAGTYTVKLTASNGNGTDSKLAIMMALKRQALVREEPVLPFANFTSNVTKGYFPLSVRFTDLSENTTAWKWDFGDGDNSTQQNPTHTYSSAGNYNVSLKASSANGTDSQLAIIMVLEHPVLPDAYFTSNTTEGYSPLYIQFSDISENAASRKWNFGDGTESTEQNPVHTYFSARSYPVTLIVTNVNGTNSTFANITVLEKPALPEAKFSANVTSGYVPLTVRFTDFSENTARWTWKFGDGTVSSQQNPKHTYSAAGTYTVNFTAINENGTDSKTTTLTVYSGLPDANFNSNVTNGYAPLPVQFSGLSDDAMEWNWDFGDGTVSSQQNPVHTYSSPGEYTVNFTAIKGKGANSKLGTIIVLEPLLLPVSNFSSDITSGYPPLSVQFTDLSENATSWFWEFGDGAISYEKNPEHTFSAIGSYNVSLKASNSNGTDSKLFVINVLKATGTFAYIANAGVSNTLSIIDTATDTVTATLKGLSLNNPFGIAVTSDGTKMYVANMNSNTVSVIDTINRTISATVPVGSTPYAVAVNPEGTKVYVTNLDSDSVSVIDTATNTVVDTLSVENDPRGVAVTPDGTTLYVTNTVNNTVSVIDTETNRIVATVNLGNQHGEGQPMGVIVTPDGKKVYIANFGGYYDYDTVSVIDTETNNIIATVNVGVWPEGIAVNPAGTKIYVTNIFSNDVSVIDIDTNNVIATVPVGDYPLGVAVTPDGTKVYVTNVNSGTVSVIDAETNTVTNTVNVGNSPFAFGQFVGTIL